MENEEEKWISEREVILDEWSEVELKSREVIMAANMESPFASIRAEHSLEEIMKYLNPDPVQMVVPSTQESGVLEEKTTWERLLRYCTCRPGTSQIPAAAVADKAAINTLAQTNYDDTNPHHWRMLSEYFGEIVQYATETIAVPSQCHRSGPHWQLVGFQGLNPATDFRGGGVFSLLQMFITANITPPNVLKFIVALSRSEPNDFPLAVLSINITGVILKLLNTQKLDSLATVDGIWQPVCKLHSLALQYFCEQYKAKSASLAQCQTILTDLETCISRNPSKFLATTSEIVG